MTQAIAPVQQTALGKLVEQREELAQQIADTRRQLKNTRACDPTRFAEARANTLKYLAEEQAKLPALVEADTERLRLLALTDNEMVREQLESSHYDSILNELRNTQSRIESYERQLATACSDPRVTLTNSLAELELALAQVKRDIKEASK